MSLYPNRKYLILNVSETNLIDFSKVLQNSVATLRKSIDKTKIIIKWEGNEPTFISSLTTKEGPYTYEEMLQILSTNAWTV